MCANLSKEQLESLVYRRERLDEQLEWLEQLVSGSQERLSPLVRTESGAHSESATQALIHELLAALETAEKQVLSKEERALFRSFLYCAIRITEEAPWWLVETSGTFQDILRLGKSAGLYSKEGLYYTELYRTPVLDGVWACMDELLWRFSGKRIEETFSDAEREWIRMLHPEESAKMEAFWRECAENEDPDWMEDDPFVDEDDYELREQEEQTEWVASFAEKEVFCREYLCFRKLYFDVADGRFSIRLRHMMDVYFAERGQSCYLDDDAFFETYVQLNEIARKLRKLSVRKG